MGSISMKQILFSKYRSYKNVQTFNVHVYAKSIQSVILLKQNITVLHIKNAQSMMGSILQELKLNNVKSEIRNTDWITKENQWASNHRFKSRELISDEMASFAILKNYIIKLFSYIESIAQKTKIIHLG